MGKENSTVEDGPKTVELRRKNGRAGFKGTCYKCGGGHRLFECPHVDRKVGDRRNVMMNETSVNELDVEEKLLVQRVLLDMKLIEPC